MKNSFDLKGINEESKLMGRNFPRHCSKSQNECICRHLLSANVAENMQPTNQPKDETIFIVHFKYINAL